MAEEWFYWANDRQLGPVSEAELEAMVRPASPPQPVQTLSYAARSNELLVLSPRIVDLLRQTRPWVKFFAVLTYIGVLAIITLGIYVIVAGIAVAVR